MDERQTLPYWENGGGFFGKKYMEGDDSFEGFLTTPLSVKQRTAREISGVIELLDLKVGSRVLDCPCGYGRHSIGLAQRNMNVIGVDINDEMLAAARSASTNVANVEFRQLNMLDLAYDREFDAVVNLFFSFGFFESDEENFQGLKKFYTGLRKGGRFLLHTDVNVARILAGHYKLHETRTLRSGRTLEINEEYNPKTKRLNTKWSLIDRDGVIEHLPLSSCRVYTAEEIKLMCMEVGFSEIGLYGDWNRSKLTSTSEEMMVVALK